MKIMNKKAMVVLLSIVLLLVLVSLAIGVQDGTIVASSDPPREYIYRASDSSWHYYHAEGTNPAGSVVNQYIANDLNEFVVNPSANPRFRFYNPQPTGTPTTETTPQPPTPTPTPAPSRPEVPSQSTASDTGMDEGDEMMFDADGSGSSAPVRIRYSAGGWHAVDEQGVMRSEPFEPEGLTMPFTTADGTVIPVVYREGGWYPVGAGAGVLGPAAVDVRADSTSILNGIYDLYSEDRESLVATQTRDQLSIPEENLYDQSRYGVESYTWLGQQGLLDETGRISSTVSAGERASITSYVNAHNTYGIPLPSDWDDEAQSTEFEERLSLAGQLEYSGYPAESLREVDWADDDQRAELEEELGVRQELISQLGQQIGHNAPLTAESLREHQLSTEELQRRVERRNLLSSMTGNPNEEMKSCGEDTCGTVHLGVNRDGRLVGMFERGEGEGTGDEGENIIMDYDVWRPDREAKGGQSLATCEQEVCAMSRQDLLCEGCAVVDRQGNRWVSKGVQYYVGEGEQKKAVTAEQCKTAKGCRAEHKGFEDSATHYYWAPRTWTDMFRGGPATQAYRSLSSIIRPFVDTDMQQSLNKWKGWLDRYFNLEEWTTRDLCTAYQASPDEGVGYSPYASGIPTATIQAQVFKVEPCQGLSGAPLDACLANRSLDAAEFPEGVYYIHRITGKIIPKDCAMQFNIYLDDVAVYDSPRVLEQGANMFDISGAYSLVLRPLPVAHQRVCIRFDNEGVMHSCLATEGSWTNAHDICNVVYESGDESITQRGNELTTEEEEASAEELSGTAPSSSTTAGCNLC